MSSNEPPKYPRGRGKKMSEVLLRQMAMLKLLPRPPRVVGTTDLKRQLKGAGFETTARTIQRDLQTLATFFAIECRDQSKPFGWRWQQDAPVFEVPAMDPKTALTLKLSAAFLRRVLPHDTFGRLKGHLEHAEKVLVGVPNNKLAAWPNKIRVVSAGLPVAYPEVATEILDVVTTALLEDRRFKCLRFCRGAGDLVGHSSRCAEGPGPTKRSQPIQRWTRWHCRTLATSPR